MLMPKLMLMLTLEPPVWVLDVDIYCLNILNQKEVIKECVHMCQMVAQFGTR